MKQLLYILCAFQFVYLLGSCEQDIDFPYEGKDRIQFQHYSTDWNGVRHYTDSIMASFGLEADSILIDTIKVVMEYLGTGSSKERTYYVSVIPDSTTAIADVHYEAIEHEQTFRPNELTDTLRIVVYRENLSDDYTNPETMRLDLQLEVSDDFDLGLRGGLKKRILINNYMSEPVWWEDNYLGTLGFFHPEKWKILISFDEAFATYGDLQYEYNNEGKTFVSQLSAYLSNFVIIDETTGMRVTMSGLEPIE